MPERPRLSDHQVDEQDHASATRRAMLWLGGRLGLAASLSALPVAARKKKKKKPPQVLFRLKADNMTGANEEPDPGDLNGSGTGAFAVRSNGTICCEFVFSTSSPNSAITDVHIHEGAAGVPGPPVVNFNKKLITCVPFASSLALDLEANPAGFYANIHTQASPNGAVRAQLSLDSE